MLARAHQGGRAERTLILRPNFMVGERDERWEPGGNSGKSGERYEGIDLEDRAGFCTNVRRLQPVPSPLARVSDAFWSRARSLLFSTSSEDVTNNSGRARDLASHCKYLS